MRWGIYPLITSTKRKLETEENAADLQQQARIIRARIIENSHRTGTPHLGSCLSCVDILTAAYFGVLRIDPANPRDPDRDRFILSKGHGAPALFQVLAERGFFDPAMLDNYGEDGSIFGEHPPTPDHLAGIEAATGSLGHGLPMGLGMAYAATIQKRDYRVFVTLGDGECNEGSGVGSCDDGACAWAQASRRNHRLQQMAGDRPQQRRDVISPWSINGALSAGTLARLTGMMSMRWYPSCRMFPMAAASRWRSSPIP